MSGIAGIVRFDGVAVTDEEVSAMTATMPHRGPHGINHWVGARAALGHCMFRTTEQSLEEAQPGRNGPADTYITMDGRLDNRGELASDLGGSLRLTRQVSDAELVLRAYEKWGVDCLPRLLGDFALALWDGRRDQLVCARDFLGKRPLLYSFSHGRFRFASEPQAVLLDPTVSRKPDAGYIAELLSAQLASTTDTLHVGVKRLPPAHFLVMDRGGVKIRRYWSWNGDAEIRYQDDRDYADHLLHICEQAVEVRLSSPWPVAASLSGGVDSSSVLGVAARLRRMGRAEFPAAVFGMVYPGRDCDESSYIREVAQHLGIAVGEFTPKAVGASAYEAQIRQFRDLPDYPMTMMHREYWAEATRLGCRSVLTGKGPDEWLAGSHYSVADHLKRGDIRALADELRSDAPTARPMAIHLWRYGFRPFVPSPLLRRLRAALDRGSCPPFLTPAFCAEVDLEDRVRRGPIDGGSFATVDVAGSLDGGWQAHANEMDERAMSAAGLEGRDPFDDRRVVEFALSVPEEQRRRAGVPKQVLREAVRGLVPEGVRTRPDKADYSHLIAEELLTQGGRSLFEDLRLTQLGWVDGPEILAVYDHFEDRYLRDDRGYRAQLWSLWLVAAVNRWMEA